MSNTDTSHRTDQQPALRRNRRWWKVARIVGGVASLLIGAFTFLITLALGHCGAFGGTCPSPDGLAGDVLGGLGFGAALAVGGPMVAARPDRVGVIRAAVVAAVVAVPAVLLLGPQLVNG